MSYAFRCPETGLVEWADCAGVHPCPFCNGKHETFQCGPPPQREGAPYVRGDRISKYFDWSCGCEIDSKTLRKRRYMEKGLVEKSEKEHRKQHNEPKYKPSVVSYAGQKNHKSSAERNWVRTKTGQRVI